MATTETGPVSGQWRPNRWLLAVMGTLLQVALGTVYAWSYFQQPVMLAGNWTNAQAAWAFSLAIFSLGIAAAWGGINLNRFGPRRLAMTGGFLFGLGYLVASCALHLRSLPLFYAGYGVVGGAGIGLGYVTPVATVAKWFPDKKGLITGMVVMGFGFGALIMSKALAPWLMALTDGNLVLVFGYLGVTMLLVTLPAGYCLTNPPSSRASADSDAAGWQQWIFSRKFVTLWFVFCANIIAGILFIGFQSPLFQELLKHSLDPARLADPQVVAELASSGATLIAVSSLFNGIGRLFWGGVSDKIGRLQVFRMILGTQCCVFVTLLFVASPAGFGALVCYVLFCYGGGFGVMPAFILDTFGPKRMPVAYGAILTAWGIAGIVGPQMVALLKDHFGGQAANYSFAIAAVLLLLGLVATCTLDSRKLDMDDSLSGAERRSV